MFRLKIGYTRLGYVACIGYRVLRGERGYTAYKHVLDR